jgi:hypothetical protein
MAGERYRDGVGALVLVSFSFSRLPSLGYSIFSCHRNHGPVAESAFVQHASMRACGSKHPPEPPSAMEGHGPVHRLRRE